MIVEILNEVGTMARRPELERIAREPHGVVVVLRPQQSLSEIVDPAAPDHAADTAAGRAVLRTYGISAQILRDLGITKMRVLSALRQLLGITAFGLEITGYEE